MTETIYMTKEEGEGMITLSELQLKEVVILQTGERLGFIHDLEIDEEKGIIKKVIVASRGTKNSFFQRTEELYIDWEDIETIGTDIILINNRAATE